MPQLDIFSYFSVTTTLIMSFIVLLFSLHVYLLPKIAKTLKFRKKYAKAQEDILLLEFTPLQHNPWVWNEIYFGGTEYAPTDSTKTKFYRELFVVNKAYDDRILRSSRKILKSLDANEYIHQWEAKMNKNATV